MQFYFKYKMYIRTAIMTVHFASK